MAGTDTRGTRLGGVAARELAMHELGFFAGRARCRAAFIDGAAQKICAASSRRPSIFHDPPARRLAMLGRPSDAVANAPRAARDPA